MKRFFFFVFERKQFVSFQFAKIFFFDSVLCKTNKFKLFVLLILLLYGINNDFMILLFLLDHVILDILNETRFVAELGARGRLLWWDV